MLIRVDLVLSERGVKYDKPKSKFSVHPRRDKRFCIRDSLNFQSNCDLLRGESCIETSEYDIRGFLGRKDVDEELILVLSHFDFLKDRIVFRAFGQYLVCVSRLFN